MKVVRCTNGHYYDSDKYMTCPHCGAENAEGGNMNTGIDNNRSFVQTTESDQYYYRNDTGQEIQPVFKTPNMNLNSESVGDFPQTVSYDYAYPDHKISPMFNPGWNNDQGIVNNTLNEERKTESGDRWGYESGQMNNPNEGHATMREGLSEEYSYGSYVSEAAPTATLNVPLMPSLRQNQFQQVPPNGFNYPNDYSGEGKTTRIDDDIHYDETAVLTSGESKPVTLNAKATLTQISTGQRFFITKDETVIGKINTKVQNDISVSNNTVSRRHACIYCVNGKLFIEDLSSTNKTHINGIDIGSNRMVELKDNDVIVLSDEEFIFSMI